MLAREKMTRHLYTATPDEDAQSACARMFELNVRHMPVVEEGRMVGLLSDRDLLLHAKSGKGYTFPEGVRVGDLMAREVVSATPDTTLAGIAQRMLERRIDAIPIVQTDGKVVGLVTSTDLLRLIARREFDVLDFRPSDELVGSYAWELCEDIV
jgi:acetoin utilization protein AcuB